MTENCCLKATGDAFHQTMIFSRRLSALTVKRRVSQLKCAACAGSVEMEVKWHEKRWHTRRGERGNWFQLTRCAQHWKYKDAAAATHWASRIWFYLLSAFMVDSRVHFFLSPKTRRPKSNDDEDFYFTDLDDEDEAIEMDVANVSPPLPPTLSHSDMARPPHEDPEYQRKIVGNIRQGLLMSSGAGNGQTYVKSVVVSNTVIHNYAAWSQTSPVSCAQPSFPPPSSWLNSTFRSSHRTRHRSTCDCRRDRPHLMHHIHRQHTPQPTIQLWFNNIIRCHHHKDQSTSYRTARRPSFRRRPSRTRCSTRPPSPSISATSTRCVRASCRPAADSAARTRSVERCTAWIIATPGARSASGRRHVAVSVTENY